MAGTSGLLEASRFPRLRSGPTFRRRPYWKSVFRNSVTWRTWWWTSPASPSLTQPASCALVRMANELADHGGVIRVVTSHPGVRKVFEMTGLMCHLVSLPPWRRYRPETHQVGPNEPLLPGSGVLGSSCMCSTPTRTRLGGLGVKLQRSPEGHGEGGTRDLVDNLSGRQEVLSHTGRR